MVTTQTQFPPAPGPARPATPAPGNGRVYPGDAWLVAAAAFLVVFAGSWVRSMWYDEAATVTGATRPLAELWRLASHVDLVHAAYYGLMHFWTGWFGVSEASLRVPSALAAAAACGLTVVLGQRMGTRATGVLAGTVLAVMPRMMWAGTEIRQYALTAALSALLALVLLRAWRTGRFRDWAAYVAVAVAGVVMFMFFAFGVAALAGAALLLRRRPVATLAASAAAGAICLPFIYRCIQQQGQVSWIRPLENGLFELGVNQFYSGTTRATGWIGPWMAALALLSLLLVVVGLVAAARTRSAQPPGPATRLLAGVGLCGLVLPFLGVLALQVFGEPAYRNRYLTYTAPFLALLVGSGLAVLLARRPRVPADRMARAAGAARVAGAAALCAVIGLGMLFQPWVRLHNGGASVPTREVAQTVAAFSGPGAAIVPNRAHDRYRFVAYPALYAAVEDLTQSRDRVAAGTLWGSYRKVTAEQLAGRGQVWWISDTRRKTPELEAFEDAGCTLVRSWTEFAGTQLREYDCAG
ncbi:hypothetical protein NCCP1664_05640 [Zafaria cholistanensis]|uniref:Glycosyltransferase RgtA/B/C/D-like domain-containing protein n=1 Tax=Zafaria cholistanensis TaxID=1682741 RepID=A0A5A7NPY0_9MICC|nr:glycosyltransferase family 39 protein [Zafaria cholistanensis]GER22067.1 hypothetical protein NCCP1664_05640 [Zafaria cholistanensis]